MLSLRTKSASRSSTCTSVRETSCKRTYRFQGQSLRHPRHGVLDLHAIERATHACKNIRTSSTSSSPGSPRPSSVACSGRSPAAGRPLFATCAVLAWGTGAGGGSLLCEGPDCVPTLSSGEVLGASAACATCDMMSGRSDGVFSSPWVRCWLCFDLPLRAAVERAFKPRRGGLQ